MTLQHLLALTSFAVLALLSSTPLAPSKGSGTPPSASLEQRDQQASKPINSSSKPINSSSKSKHLQKMKVVDISERNLNGKNGIAVTLSQPVDSSIPFQSYLAINQKEGERVNGEWVVGDEATILWFMNVEPQTSYTLAVNPGLQAINGDRLIQSKQTTITTRKLKPSINFSSNGSILPLNYTSGLPVTSVNTKEVDVDFFQISNDQLAEFSANIQRYAQSSWYAEHLSKQGTLVYSARFQLEETKNTLSQSNLPIHSIKELQQAGVYFAVMRRPGSYDNKQMTWFSVSDIGIHIRQYDNQMDVHVNSLQTGKPVSGVHVQLLNQKSQIIHENRSTPKGQASFSGDLTQGMTLIARADNQMTLVDLRQPSLDLSDFDLGSRPQKPIELFLYSPRDLYRPGEQITISGLVRDHDGRLQHAPVLNGNIKTPNGSSAKNFSWQAQRVGYYEYQWTIPEDAPTGNWQVDIRGSLQSPITYRFHVEEFLPERLKLSLANNSHRTEYSSEKEVSLAVSGEYLYGAPAANNRLSTFYQSSVWRSPIESLQNYEFGHLLSNSASTHHELPDTVLDDDGNGSIIFANQWLSLKAPTKILVTSSLYESGGRPVTRSHPILIWPSKSMIGIRPNFKKDQLKANTTARFDIVNATLQGNLLPARSIDITLIKEDRQYFWEYSDSEGWHWEWTDKTFPVANKQIAIEEGRTATVSLPIGWGNYRIVARNMDNDSISSFSFFAGHNWYYDWKNANNNSASPTQVNLALDKNRYQAGDIAQLKIIPPTAGEVLILVEGDTPLWSKKITLPSDGTVIDIPIEHDWSQHNLYISALLIEPSGGKETITPKRSLGLIHLPLDRDNRKLNIEIDVAKKIKPNSILNTKIAIKNTRNKPTYVTLAAVDVGVLSMSNFGTPDPFQYFFGQRRYQINIQDMYNKVIESNRAANARIKFGGDSDLSRGGDKPQSEVKIVSLFSGLIQTNSDGEAIIPLSIPDFNGRIRLMAVAFNDDAFGSTDTEVTIASPIITEISMPRFLAYGDKSISALDIQNMTEVKQTFLLNISTQDGLKPTHKQQTLTLSPQQKKTLRIPIEAKTFTGIGRVALSITSKGVGDFQRSWPIGLRPAYPALTQRESRILAKDEEWAFNMGGIHNLLIDSLKVQTSISSTVDLNIADQLKNLLAYPYGCLEQTSSKGYPLLFANVENQTRFNIPTISDETRKDMIQQGVDRIARFQKHNGAFGLWAKTSPEEHWLSVYATDFLINAKSNGATVPRSILEKAIKRLTFYLNSSGTFAHQRWSNDDNHYAFATRAYAAYVLSKFKQAPLGSLRTLYKRDFEQAKTGLSQTHLALAILAMGDHGTGLEALETALKNIPEDYAYWGDYGSKVRDLGMMVHLLFEHKQFEDQALALGLRLKKALKEKTGFSTQERTALFLSGIALNTESKNPWQAEIAYSQNPPEGIRSKKNWRRLFTGSEIGKNLTIKSQHGQPLFTDILVSGYTTKAPMPSNENIQITRAWFNAKGKKVTPKTIRVGELYLVHLHVHSEKRVQDAMVINLLPAGLELENQNLEHVIKLDDFKINGQQIAQLQAQNKVSHTEYRDDRYISAIDNRRESHLFFAVRAVTPGTYQVPPPMVEDMYRPEIHSIGATIDNIEILDPLAEKQ